MSLPIRFAESASDDLIAAIRWYEARRAGLGRELLAAVEETLSRVASGPESGASLSPDDRTRRLLVARFPYQIVYRVRPTDIAIVAIAHLRRRPGYWARRS